MNWLSKIFHRCEFETVESKKVEITHFDMQGFKVDGLATVQKCKICNKEIGMIETLNDKKSYSPEFIRKTC